MALWVEVQGSARQEHRPQRICVHQALQGTVHVAGSAKVLQANLTWTAISTL